MNINEALKILRKPPDYYYSLDYYQREIAVDTMLEAYDKLNLEIEKQLIEAVYKEDWNHVQYLNELLGGNDDDLQKAKEYMKNIIITDNVFIDKSKKEE